MLGLRPPGLEFQCYLINLMILKRFSWPSLAYTPICGLKPNLFHYIYCVEAVAAAAAAVAVAMCFSSAMRTQRRAGCAQYRRAG